MKRYKRVTLENFDQIKLLKGAGLTNKQIEDITGRSLSTISKINEYEVYQEYRDFITERNRLNKAKRAAEVVEKVFPDAFLPEPSLELSDTDKLVLLAKISQTSSIILDLMETKARLEAELENGE